MRDPRRACGRGWFRPLGSVLLFMVSFLLFDRLVFMGLRGMASHYYGRQVATQNRLRAALKKKRVNGLIFGSSRARSGISANVLSRVLKQRIHKETLAGKYPAYSQLFFQQMQPYLGELRFVVYVMDYFIFRHRSSIQEMANLRKVSRAEVLNPGGIAGYSPFSLNQFSLLYRVKPEIDEFFVDWLRLGSADRDEAVGRAPAGREKAGSAGGVKRLRQPRAGPQSGSRGRERRAGAGLLALQPPLQWQRKAYERFPGEEGRNLLELLRELSSRRIAIFLVILPDYVGTYETNFEQEAFKKEVRSLAARFPLAFVLDFNTLERFRLKDPSLFSDGGWGLSSSHLSSRGRTLVSREIALAIKSHLGIR